MFVLSNGILTKSIDAQEEMFEGSNLSRFRLQQDSNIKSLYKYDCERSVMISI
jgi:hypothetical protein